MKKFFLCVFFLLFISVFSISATAGTILRDGKEWLQVADYMDLSWDILNSMYGSDGTWNGLNNTELSNSYFEDTRWATQNEVSDLFDTYTGLSIPASGEVYQSDAGWADEIMSPVQFTPTGVDEAYAVLYGWTSTPSPENKAYFASILNWADPTINDRASIVDTFGRDFSSFSVGAWIYRDTTPAPVPEPSTIILFSLGIIGSIGIKRRKTAL